MSVRFHGLLSQASDLPSSDYATLHKQTLVEVLRTVENEKGELQALIFDRATITFGAVTNCFMQVPLHGLCVLRLLVCYVILSDVYSGMAFFSVSKASISLCSQLASSRRQSTRRPKAFFFYCCGCPTRPGGGRVWESLGGSLRIDPPPPLGVCHEWVG